MTPSRRSKGVATSRSPTMDDHTSSIREMTAAGSGLEPGTSTPTWAWTVALAAGLAALLLLATPVVGEHRPVPWNDARDGVRTANATVQEAIDVADNGTTTAGETTLYAVDMASNETENKTGFAMGEAVDLLADAADNDDQECPLHFDPSDGGHCVIPNLPDYSDAFYTYEEKAQENINTGIVAVVRATHKGVTTGQHSARVVMHEARDTAYEASHLIAHDHGPAARPDAVDEGRRLVDGTTRHGERGSAGADGGTQASDTELVTRSQGLAVPNPGSLDPTGRVAIAGYAVVTATSLLLLFLYRRLSRDDVLDNDIRSAILDLVEDQPGISPTEIADELDIATNTVIYHARILTEMDYLATDRSGQRTTYFAEGACDRRAAELTALLRQRGKRDVLVAARREPGLSISELARRLDKHRSTVKHHVDDLVDAGVLDAEQNGNGRRVAVPEPLRSLDVWETDTS